MTPATKIYTRWPSSSFLFLLLVFIERLGTDPSARVDEGGAYAPGYGGHAHALPRPHVEILHGLRRGCFSSHVDYMHLLMRLDH